MRKVIIAGNWKMNKTEAEAIGFSKSLLDTKLINPEKEVMIFAPSIYLKELAKAFIGTDVTIGAQNIHQEKKGAFTGEISAEMLKSIGINHTLIGHSERRQYFDETNKIVNEKMKAALLENIKPILCIGEVLEEREAKITNEVLTQQLTEGLAGVAAEDIVNVVIAYEPVWAIGTGKTATSEDANLACEHVRSVIAELYGAVIAEGIVIQYGGSVKPENIEELLAESDIDGALVGGASLDVESFIGLIK